MNHVTIKNVTNADVLLDDVGVLIPRRSSVTIEQKVFDSSVRARQLPIGTIVVQKSFASDVVTKVVTSPVQPISVPDMAVSDKLDGIRSVLESILSVLKSQPIMQTHNFPSAVSSKNIEPILRLEEPVVVLPGRITPNAEVHMTIESDSTGSASHDEAVDALRKARRK